jgi:uncharacterized protein (DUF302 family)
MHEGLETISSTRTVDEVVSRLQSLLHDRNIKLFCLVDHSGEAEAAGISMPPTKLLIFGNAKAGTPLMLDAPSVAIDLPLKILITQAESGKTLLFWNSPEYLEERHGFRSTLIANIAAIKDLAEQAATGE